MAYKIRPMCCCIPFLAALLCSTTTTAEEQKEVGRPSLALSLKLDGKVAKITIALNYLLTAKDEPKTKGVRQYTYDIPIGKAAIQVGWAGGEATIPVLIHGQKFTYMAGIVDR